MRAWQPRLHCTRFRFARFMDRVRIKVLRGFNEQWQLISSPAFPLAACISFIVTSFPKQDDKIQWDFGPINQPPTRSACDAYFVMFLMSRRFNCLNEKYQNSIWHKPRQNQTIRHPKSSRPESRLHCAHSHDILCPKIYVY